MTYLQAVLQREQALTNLPPRLGLYLPGDGVSRARGMRMLRHGEVAHPWVLLPCLNGREVAHYTATLASTLTFDELLAAEAHARLIRADSNFGRRVRTGKKERNRP